ncbi:MAG: radical SAM protein [Gemmatimonadetes bacterium]|nr:radical SAM protein [Gemmatimonadota bacterium]
MAGAASLRDPGAILLLSCYELGHQPQGLASPLAFLRRAGYQPEAVDLAVAPLEASQVGRARFVGISVPMHTALRLGVPVARRVRRLNPAAFICFYGLYAALNAQYLIAEVADAAIGGESEATVVEQVAALERGGRPGAGRPAVPLARLDFPVPERAVLPPLARYAQLDEDGARRPAGYVEASRGCLHHCLHCPIPPVYGGRFFVVPRDVVLEDVRRQVDMGATHITFGDPDFLNGPGHSLRIVRAMHAEFPELTFDFTAKIEHILRHRGVFPELAASGCLFIVSAVESLSDLVLANLEKGHTRADVLEALNVVRKAGIALRPSFVPFTPWARLTDYVELFEFAEGEELIDDVDPVQYTIRLLVPPGSLLLERAALRPYLGPLDREALTYRWKHPDPRMDRLHAAAAVLVEGAARAGEDPRVTFYRLWNLARAAGEDGGPPAESAAALRLAAVGSGAQVLPDQLVIARPRPPRLTEPWFC